MRQWVQKLIDQLEYDWSGGEKPKETSELSDERATLLYILDVLSKYLVEIEGHPVRKVRETLDSLTQSLLQSGKKEEEDTLFRLRQFFSSYRTAEHAFLTKAFEDFKSIVWNFVEQLGDEAKHERASDRVLGESLKELRDAVEADSIPLLRQRSKHFIDLYKEHQNRKDERRNKRAKTIKRNLDLVKKQLVEADRSMRLDHLTQAYNRRSFDEAMKEQIQIASLGQTPVTLIAMDIDHFKKINDTHGHDVGDFVLIECVKLLQHMFGHEGDFVARVGGEEFMVLLPNHSFQQAIRRAEEALKKIRADVFITGERELRFTMSMGIAQWLENETPDQWIKRADQALYQSKQNGRNRFTLASPHVALTQVA